MFKPLLSKIMREAHARAKADFADDRADKGAHVKHRPYSYYLGLQMRSGYAEARIALTGVAYVTSFTASGIRSAF